MVIAALWPFGEILSVQKNCFSNTLNKVNKSCDGKRTGYGEKEKGKENKKGRAGEMKLKRGARWRKTLRRNRKD